ncbi:tRNA lysidine(34) synthetase TilS [Arthrobacter mobilis]|uniref:tRNA(Ile)-lysidine synthase n=1 Tax=Arthrobacter mobilis TaxID=2724944 RepID=A0A7X6HEV0_9MICC|nr:tRNA lysidine(34) synthetase TilS [Arthrobacter mobilis]NKX55095.1 tRNA lysidine(34) synthetase TilS [Arthrobacter mobilis]
MSPEAGTTRARKRRLDPLVGTARNHLRAALELLPGAPVPAAEPPLLLVACSGGPDSLALAAVTAYFGRPRRDGTRAFRVGAVVVDHGLQPGSAAVAGRTRAQLEQLGLDPVQLRRVSVQAAGMGPEAAARTARYAALEAAAAELGAAAVLLGHTLDDQAEQVLLGLGRGSGTRSLAGMPARRGLFLRPFLELRRTDTEQLCRIEGLAPWHDPTNTDPAYLRSRVRTRVLPFLEEELGPGVARALWRSARILRADADYLDSLASAEYARLRSASAEGIELDRAGLAGLPDAMRHRVIALAAAEMGGENPSYERLLAAEALLRRQGSAGPVQLAGKVSVYRRVRTQRVPQDARGYGNLVFRTTGQPADH